MHFKTRLLLAFGSLLFSAAVYADEGRINITGPTNISAPGSYILLNDVVGTFTAIRIESSNVKLDLNGFTVGHTGVNSADGITISPGVKNVEITNGAITGQTRHAIFAPGSSTVARNIRINNLRISDNVGTGIRLESNLGYNIEDCQISGGSIGVYANGGGLMTNSVISGTNTGMASFSSTFGYRSNVFFANGTNISGSATNLGQNLCSGAICP
jgi:hypothetical protein